MYNISNNTYNYYVDSSASKIHRILFSEDKSEVIVFLLLPSPVILPHLRTLSIAAA